MLETVRTFTALSEEFVEESLRLWPVQATAAGIHDYDHRLPDDTPDGFRARGAWLRDLEQRLAASVTWEELPTEQRVDYALLRSRISVLRAELEEIRAHARDPVACLRTALDGVALLVARPFAPFEERREAIIGRLMAIPEYLAAAGANLEQVPAAWVELALEVTDGGPPFVNGVAHALLRAFPNDAERIEHAGVRAIAGFVAFRETLERDLGPRAGGDFALGERWLDFRIEREHLLSLKNQALEQLGREQVTRLRRLLEAEALRLDPHRSWREQVEEARWPAEPGAQRAALKAELERAQRFVAERQLVPMPEVPLTVAEAEAWQRPLRAGLSYLPPAPFDLEPAGLLSVTAVEKVRRSPTQAEPPARSSPTLAAAREGWPGRHLQGALAIHCGSRLRRLAGNSVFAEGWALYAEEAMAEEGFCTAPADRLGLILDLLAGAGRAVADVGLHGGRMSLAAAASYLADEALLGPPAALAEAKRLTLAPAQVLGGLVGRLQILELREEAKRRLGSRYDRLDFHAALLAGGTLPPALIGEELWERLGVD
jgi:uncharacterized protein (DUF885 family)